jgi:hypothetical protein
MQKLKHMRLNSVYGALNKMPFCTNTPIVTSNAEHPMREKFISSKFIFLGVTIGIGCILYTYLIVTWQRIVRREKL